MMKHVYVISVSYSNGDLKVKNAISRFLRIKLMLLLMNVYYKVFVTTFRSNVAHKFLAYLMMQKCWLGTLFNQIFRRILKYSPPL